MASRLILSTPPFVRPPVLGRPLGRGIFVSNSIYLKRALFIGACESAGNAAADPRPIYSMDNPCAKSQKCQNAKRGSVLALMAVLAQAYLRDATLAIYSGGPERGLAGRFWRFGSVGRCAPPERL